MYPALAVWQALRNKAVDVLWVGGKGGMEGELVRRAGIPFETIPAAGLHGVGLRRLPGNAFQLALGYLAARRIIRNFDPEVLLFTGGYLAFPMAAAGRRRPSLVFVPDIEPGLALKAAARFARRIAVTAEDSRRFFAADKSVTVTGYPARADLLAWEPEAARRALGLEPGLETLLVFGGSKGARSINRALLAALPDLLLEMQVIHISGTLDWPAVQAAAEALSDDLRRRYLHYPYLHEEMGAALRTADLVISRAGASTLGEFPAFGLPAILVPYPYAWRYQATNAAFLVERDAALLLEDAELPTRLLPTVLDLMRDRPRRDRMRASMRSLANPNAARDIAGLLLRLASGAEG